MVKYTLEKDLKEQERKLQLHVQSSEQHLNQLTETEHRFKALQLQCKQLSEAQAQLEDSGKLDFCRWKMAVFNSCMYSYRKEWEACSLFIGGRWMYRYKGHNCNFTYGNENIKSNVQEDCIKISFQILKF